MAKRILHDHNHDGIDRRGFLECMAWAGTGALCVLGGGVLKSFALADAAEAAKFTGKGLSFVQISDSHIGFNKPANPDVAGTLKAAIEKINALPVKPAFVLHTGDITQLSKPEEFDTAAQLLKGLKTDQIFYVPGEHDVLDGTGQLYRERHAANSAGDGWYSFDAQGTHFLALVNVLNLKAGGLGNLGSDQLEWLKKDLAGVSSETPVVVFAHIPLWSVYPDWGWGTDDSEQALGLMKRFGSVTVLNGHIHQTMRKVEGNVTFHTAMSTAFPQAAPGTPGASPGPMAVPADRLRSVLGITDVKFQRGKHALAVTDSTLAEAGTANMEPMEVQPA
jgi:3',5'-cyclic AMP phosphodiesterase CpdA